MAIWTGLSDRPLPIAKAIEFAKSPRAGAIVYFGGCTRDSAEGKHVDSLEYEAYTARAEQTLRQIAADAEGRHGIQNVVVLHRVGVVPLCQESLCIVIAAAHRREAWDAGEWVLEEVKRTCEIWKREMYSDGSNSWVPGAARKI